MADNAVRDSGATRRSFAIAVSFRLLETALAADRSGAQLPPPVGRILIVAKIRTGRLSSRSDRPRGRLTVVASDCRRVQGTGTKPTTFQLR